MAVQQRPWVGKSVLSVCGIPFIHLSSGTMGNNGALSAVTALPTTYAGAYCYLPTAAIAAGSVAGWYWVVFSSTTAGTVYNSVYTSGQPQVGAATAFATTGPGAFTGSTAAVAGPDIPVAGGVLGPHGAFRLSSKWSATNNANAKTIAWRAGTTSIVAGTALTSQAAVDTEFMVHNRGVQNSQVSHPNAAASYGNGASTTARLYTTVDLSVATSINVYFASKAVATDNAVLEAYAIEAIT